MKEKTIKYLSKNILILVSLLGGICLMSGCGNKEIVFEKMVNEQAEQEDVQEVQTTDSMQVTNQDNAQTNVQETFQQEAYTQGETVQTDSAQVQECYVDICGAVVTPGVYQVEADTRIYEVVLLAGGLTPDAEQSCINQALFIYDGMKLIIPTKAEWEAGEYILDENGLVISAGKEQGALKETSQTQEDGLININEATIEELCTLPGVGTTKAESIIAYREQHGKFASIEDIKKVAGIKEGLFEKIKAKIKV